MITLTPGAEYTGSLRAGRSISITPSGTSGLLVIEAKRAATLLRSIWMQFNDPTLTLGPHNLDVNYRVLAVGACSAQIVEQEAFQSLNTADA